MGSLPLGGGGLIWTALLKMAGDRTAILLWGWAAAGFDWQILSIALLSSGDLHGEPLTSGGN